jgi:hypothetical protein
MSEDAHHRERDNPGQQAEKKVEAANGHGRFRYGRIICFPARIRDHLTHSKAGDRTTCEAAAPHTPKLNISPKRGFRRYSTFPRSRQTYTPKG